MALKKQKQKQAQRQSVVIHIGDKTKQRNRAKRASRPPPPPPPPPPRFNYPTVIYQQSPFSYSQQQTVASSTTVPIAVPTTASLAAPVSAAIEAPIPIISSVPEPVQIKPLMPRLPTLPHVVQSLARNQVRLARISSLETPTQPTSIADLSQQKQEQHAQQLDVQFVEENYATPPPPIRILEKVSLPIQENDAQKADAETVTTSAAEFVSIGEKTQPMLSRSKKEKAAKREAAALAGAVLDAVAAAELAGANLAAAAAEPSPLTPISRPRSDLSTLGEMSTLTGVSREVPSAPYDLQFKGEVMGSDSSLGNLKDFILYYDIAHKDYNLSSKKGAWAAIIKHYKDILGVTISKGKS